MLILEGVGFGLLIGPSWPDGISLMLVWYGLYYGVLGRDLAEVAGDRMVSKFMATPELLAAATASMHAACNSISKSRAVFSCDPIHRMPHRSEAISRGWACSGQHSFSCTRQLAQKLAALYTVQ